MSRTIVLPLALALAACGGSRDAAQEFAVRDSAGVQLVHNGAAGVLPQAALDSPRLTMRIGEVDGAPEYQHFRLRDMAVGPSGEIYAVDAGHAEVRVFDAEGRYVRAYGRKGEGPGEFEFPSGLWLLGDTIAVYDVELSRMTLFDIDGRLLDTWRDGGSRSGHVAPLGTALDGWIVAPSRYTGWPYQPGVVRRDTTTIAFVSAFEPAVHAYETASGGDRLESDTTVIRTIIAYPRGRMMGVNTPRAMIATDPLFEPRPQFAIDGRGLVHFSPANAYVIETRDAKGRLVRRLTRDYEPVPVSADLVDRFRERVRAHWDTASMTGEAAMGKVGDEARAADLDHVENLPPIGRMFASSEGALWVERIDLVPDPLELEWQRPPPPARETKWDIFDPDGRFLGTATLPPKFSPRLVGERWVLGVLRDELDVQYVARYEIGDGQPR